MLDHVEGIEQRSRKHEFPVQRDALPFKLDDVERRAGIVDDSQLAFGSQYFGNLGKVFLRLYQACHVWKDHCAPTRYSRRNRPDLLQDLPG